MILSVLQRAEARPVDSIVSETRPDVPRPALLPSPLHLGEGNSGSVYRIHNRSLDRPVAVKLFTAQGQDPRHVMRHEYGILTLLAGGFGAARVYAEGVLSRGIPYLVMEFLGGGTLLSWMKSNLSEWLARKLEIMIQAAACVVDIEKHGVRHRDVKPANFVFDDAGRLKLVDLANAVAETGLKPTWCFGTLQYVPPEILDGTAEDSPTWDVYSLGALCYSLSFGEQPFKPKANEIPFWIETKKNEIVPSRSQLRMALDPALEALYHSSLKALSSDPARRHPTAAAFYEDLLRCRSLMEETTLVTM